MSLFTKARNSLPARSRRNRSQRTQSAGATWYLVLLGIMFFLYWLFAWYLERVELVLPPGLNVLDVLPPLAAMLVRVALEMLFSPRIWRHFLPIILGWYLAYEATLRLLVVLYELPDRQKARDFLRRVKSSGPPLEIPVTISAQTLDIERQRSTRLRIGGPGKVVIPLANVAVTERNGRFYRVLGLGKHTLGHFEFVHTVVDLRQQEREAAGIPLLTKDGIQISADISIIYRISSGGEPLTKINPFPFDSEAVCKVAYNETVLPDGRIATWENKPIGAVRGALINTVAKYPLDELLHPTSPASEPHYTIRTEVERNAKRSLAKSGIDLLRVRIGRLDLPEAVSKQYIQHWQAYWETQAQITQADGAAQALEEMEIANAEAEIKMTEAILEGIRRAKLSSGDVTVREIMAVRLVESLEMLAQQSQQAAQLPKQLLPRLRSLRQDLLEEGKG